MNVSSRGAPDGYEKPETVSTTDWLRYLILNGRYGPGERLREEQLAGSLGVSRTPIRHALIKLETEGLVETQPNRGATVFSFTVEDVWQTYDLRAVLEGHAALRAAGRVREAHLIQMRSAVHDFEGYSAEDVYDPEEQIRHLVRCNQDFHGAVIVASGNPRLERLLYRTVELPLVFKAVAWYTTRERGIANHHHRQILRALEAGDGDRAEILMREHVYEGRDRLVRALERDSDGTPGSV